MIAFVVSLNGERVCTIGIGDRGVLGAHVSWSGRPGGAGDLWLSYGGLDSRTDEHVKWADPPEIMVGDTIAIQVIETDGVDPPAERETILPDWNEPAADFPREPCLHQPFRQRGRPCPDAPAVVHDGGSLTYAALDARANRLAHHLRSLGVGPDVLVGICVERSFELVVGLLAIAKSGGAYVPMDPAYPRERLAFMLEDSRVGVLLTQRSLSAVLPEPRGEVQVVLLDDKRGGNAAVPDSGVGPENLAYVIYTSGSTGKPKGVLHTTGGYLVYVAMTHQYVFDYHDGEIYWCTADVGWVTGHSYIVYGPLANGATSLMYEGAPNWPGPDRLWQIAAKHRVNIFYTAPTAIRAFMKWGPEWPARHDLRSLRLLGTVGEPINPEAWMWYHRVIGKERCPIVDTWWQTETGGILITPLPGEIATKPGSATRPFPGVAANVYDESGRPVRAPKGGFFVLEKPWPGMLRKIWGDPKRFEDQYWSRFEKIYLAGDGAYRDADDYFWIMGRIDDVMNVSGHRIGTMEVESALVSHPSVAEAAVVGRPDDLTGTAIVAFVTPRAGTAADDALRAGLLDQVASQIGPIAKPKEIRFTDALPKTRSGKIMRRVLKAVVLDRDPGDITTIEDEGSVEEARQAWIEMRNAART